EGRRSFLQCRRSRVDPSSRLLSDRKDSDAMGQQGRLTRATARLVAAMVAITVGISGLPATAHALGVPLPGPGPGVSAAVPLDSGPLDPPGLPVVSRSETTNVFRQDDGNGVLYSYAGPVNWLAPDGRWVPFDTSIISDGL